MAWQLIYTSAPRGLVTGRSGFCTVARHRDLRERLAADLERWSSYDRSGEIPETIFSHRILTAGQETFHVLTRIAAAGVDYTGRSNHLAHHLIFSPAETAALPNPAALLRAWPGWLSRYDEAPRFFEENEQPSLSGLSPISDAAADPAATLLATEEGRKGSVLAARPESASAVLTTFEKALADSDPTVRWDVTFTTWLQPADLEEWPAWSAAPVSSHAWEKAKASGKTLLDPTRPGGLPAAAPPRARSTESSAPAAKATAPSAAEERPVILSKTSRPAIEAARARPSFTIRPVLAAAILLILFALVGSLFLFMKKQSAGEPLTDEIARLEAHNDAAGMLRLVEREQAKGTRDLGGARQWLQGNAWIDRLDKARNTHDTGLVRELLEKIRTDPSLDSIHAVNASLALAISEADTWLQREDKENRETVQRMLQEWAGAKQLPPREEVEQVRAAIALLPSSERAPLLGRVQTLASPPDVRTPRTSLAALLGARTTWIGLRNAEGALSWPASLTLCTQMIPAADGTLRWELIGSAQLPPQSQSIVVSARPPKPGDAWRFYDRLNLLLELQAGPDTWQLVPGKDFDKSKIDPAQGFILRSMTGTFQLVVPGTATSAALARAPGDLLVKNDAGDAVTLAPNLLAGSALLALDAGASVLLRPHTNDEASSVPSSSLPLTQTDWPEKLSLPVSSAPVSVDLCLESEGRVIPVITFDPDFQLPEPVISPL
jgi:hypothetical protein